jgi:hypothetical protein
MFVCSHFGAHPFAGRVMKIALYGEKLTLEQGWDGTISTAEHAVLRSFGFMNTYVHSTEQKIYCGHYRHCNDSSYVV